MASCAVVLAVGARLCGQASLSTELSSTASAWRASVDSGRPVSAIRGTPMRLMSGRMALSSSLSPLLLMPSTTSAAVIMPRSPWLASAGCTNMAGVPVEASVAAILRPMWPLLPMPMTTTRPRQANMAATAVAKVSFTRKAMAVTACASMLSVSWAIARARAASKVAGRVMAGLSPWVLLAVPPSPQDHRPLPSPHDLARHRAAVLAGLCAGRGRLPSAAAAAHAGLPGRWAC